MRGATTHSANTAHSKPNPASKGNHAIFGRWLSNARALRFRKFSSNKTLAQQQDTQACALNRWAAIVPAMAGVGK